jgi:hypothetical protein
MTIEKLAQDPNGAPDPISGAQPGSNPQFERSFSDLAYARLKDKAPKLLDYLVGFQVIEKNDDETKAAGVFCFKVGRQILYAPVFFIEGELKGHELLYIKEQDAFVPMQENWVNYILSRKPAIIGESGKGNEYEMGIRNPDFYAYRASPLRGFNKMSHADYDPTKADEIYGYWHSGEKFDITPIDRALCLSVNSPIFKAAAANCDLTKLIPALGVKAAGVIVATIAARPDFARALSKFYNGSDLLPKSAAVEVPVTPPTDAMLHANGLDRKLFGYYVKKLAAASNKAVLSGTDKAVVRILQSCGVKSAAYLPAVLEIGRAHV